MNEKQALSSDQIQAKLKNLQQSAGPPDSTGEGSEVEITVASQRDAFDLPACRALLREHGISSQLAGRGFNQMVVVARADSSRALDLITAQRERLLRKTPLTAGDYIVGILAWALGCGLGIPAVVGLLLLYRGIGLPRVAVTAAILLGCSVLLGGFLGYLRCRAIASRKRA